jgi:hypothetical protein
MNRSKFEQLLLKTTKMKKTVFTVVLLAVMAMTMQGISPYLRVAELDGSMDAAREKVVNTLSEKGYEILGQYAPGENSNLYVVVFTSDQLISLCKKSKDRGMLAATMKVGFQVEKEKIIVSLLNPEYLFYAYFREKMEDSSFKSSALTISSAIQNDIQGVGSIMEPFGGDLSSEKLMKYKYMVGMPKFDKPVELMEFDSFEKGLATIRKNLSAGKDSTTKVYEIVDQEKKVAVIGVGLLSLEEGEAHFLPIVGESHVAAMPYEIILEGKEATMLHGRFRFALHWPELTMGTFTKIMSSPGDVEDAMKALME